MRTICSAESAAPPGGPETLIEMADGTATLSPRGQAWLDELRRQFDGNGIRAAEIGAAGETAETYAVAAAIRWRFGHQVRTRTVKGLAAADRHFGYRQADFDGYLSALALDAAANRDLRGPFMQRVLVAGAESLAWSGEGRVVQDFGEISVCRHCSPCRGSGQVACGSCGGGGRRSCPGCGGSGSTSHVESRAQWNGTYHQTCSTTVYRSCSHCFGAGRVVCTGCGGAGRQTCPACVGHGMFTDIAHTQAVATPVWHVPEHRGLHADALVHALKAHGPAGARELVSFEIERSGYGRVDEWIVHYRGLAQVLALDLLIRSQRHEVAAAGTRFVPIVTAAVVDQILADELLRLRPLVASRQGARRLRAQAKGHFNRWRKLPMLDDAMQRLARQAAAKASEPAMAAAAVTAAACGFVSPQGAHTFGTAMVAVLGKVSPTHSRLAWWLVATPLAALAFGNAANTLGASHGASLWYLGFLAALLAASSALGMLVASPLAWALSTVVSGLWRLRVPAPYRRRGRNWAPLRGACAAAASTCVLGAAYGGASVAGLVPRWNAVTAYAASRLVDYLPPDGSLHQLVTAVFGTQTGHAGPTPARRLAEPDAWRQVQRHLIARGYMRGAIDGVPGPNTRAAMASYARDQGLPRGASVWDVLGRLEAN